MTVGDGSDCTCWRKVERVLPRRCQPLGVGGFVTHGTGPDRTTVHDISWVLPVIGHVPPTHRFLAFGCSDGENSNIHPTRCSCLILQHPIISISHLPTSYTHLGPDSTTKHHDHRTNHPTKPPKERYPLLPFLNPHKPTSNPFKPEPKSQPNNLPKIK